MGMIPYVIPLVFYTHEKELAFIAEDTEEFFMLKQIDIACEDLHRQYVEEHQGVVALAKHYKCSATTISKRLHACGIPVRDSRFQPRNIPDEELRYLYEDKQLSVRDIARHFGVSTSTIGNRRRALGIAKRPRKEYSNPKKKVPF